MIQSKAISSDLTRCHGRFVRLCSDLGTSWYPACLVLCFWVVKWKDFGSSALHLPQLYSASTCVELEEQQVAALPWLGICVTGLCNGACCVGCFSSAFPWTCVWVFVWIGQREWSLLKRSCRSESFHPEKMKPFCPFLLKRLEKGFNIWEMLGRRCCWKEKVQSGVS